MTLRLTTRGTSDPSIRQNATWIWGNSDPWLRLKNPLPSRSTLCVGYQRVISCFVHH